MSPRNWIIYTINETICHRIVAPACLIQSYAAIDFNSYLKRVKMNREEYTYAKQASKEILITLKDNYEHTRVNEQYSLSVYLE